MKGSRTLGIRVQCVFFSLVIVLPPSVFVHIHHSFVRILRSPTSFARLVPTSTLPYLGRSLSYPLTYTYTYTPTRLSYSFPCVVPSARYTSAFCHLYGSPSPYYTRTIPSSRLSPHVVPSCCVLHVASSTRCVLRVLCPRVVPSSCFASSCYTLVRLLLVLFTPCTPFSSSPHHISTVYSTTYTSSGQSSCRARIQTS